MNIPYIYEALNWASSFLGESGREPQAAVWLLAHKVNTDQTSLHLDRGERLTEEVWNAFQKDVKTHASGVPVQHITGEGAFYGRVFSVDKHVLIPRPETEELAHEVIQWLGRQKSGSIRSGVDIGTGSGALAVTIALESESIEMTATDLMTGALQKAEQNADKLGAAIEFIQGDLARPLQGRMFDVVVSNPPYIPVDQWEKLDDIVKVHEPRTALVGADEDGLSCYRKLAEDIPAILNRPGLAAFEIGMDQGRQALAIFKQAFPDDEVWLKQDINKRDRMIFVEKR